MSQTNLDDARKVFETRVARGDGPARLVAWAVDCERIAEQARRLYPDKADPLEEEAREVRRLVKEHLNSVRSDAK